MEDAKPARCSDPFVSATELLDTALPGDLIEFQRYNKLGVPYQHWAMYLGRNGKDDGDIMNIPAESKEEKEVRIRRESFLERAGKSKVRVNNQEDVAHELGLKRRSVKDALAAAYADEAEEEPLPYGFLNKNCEYYCTKWLYGHGFSKQVMDRVTAAATVSGGIGALIGTTLGGPGLGATTAYQFGSAVVQAYYTVYMKDRDTVRIPL